MRFAVTTVAEKLPLPSRFTTVDAVAALVAADISVAAKLSAVCDAETSPVIPENDLLSTSLIRRM